MNSPGIWLRYFNSVLVSEKKTTFNELFKKARAVTSGDSMILRTSPVLTHSIGRVNHPPTYYEVLTQQQAPSNLRW